MLLGSGEAGKTTLKNQLLNLNLLFAKKPKNVLQDYVGTVGIEKVQVLLLVLDVAHKGSGRD